MSESSHHSDSDLGSGLMSDEASGSSKNQRGVADHLTDASTHAHEVTSSKSDIHEDLSALRPPSMVTKRLIHEVARVEKALANIDAPDDFEDDEVHSLTDPECDEALDELNQAISEVEALVAALQKKVDSPEDPDSSECFDCVTMRIEMASMKSRMEGLEAELAASRARLEELERGGKRTATPESSGPKSPVAAVSASSRLRNVTAALTKALSSRKSTA